MEKNPVIFQHGNQVVRLRELGFHKGFYFKKKKSISILHRFFGHLRSQKHLLAVIFLDSASVQSAKKLRFYFFSYIMQNFFE